MGVKLLNSYLRRYASKSLEKMSLNDLRNKKIAVDVSIYIYKFLGSETLLESIFNMCFKFREYNIHAVFVFDGKPPKEKSNELERRSKEKKNAEVEYKSIENQINLINERINNEVDKEIIKKEICNKNELMDKMQILKKKFVRINDKIISDVKSLIMACGLSYIESPCEADVICSYLTKNNIVYATMSEDMDMFVLGCPRVIRYFSLIKNNCVLYNLAGILNELDINKKNFTEMCIYSGTDYNDKRTSFYDNMTLYNKNKVKVKESSFYDFILTKNNNCINNDEFSELKHIYEMFTNVVKYDFIDKIKIHNMIYNKENIKNILKQEKFIFV